MLRPHSAKALGTGLLARSSAGRDLAAELRNTYTPTTAPVIGVSLGRIVVLVRGAGLAARPAVEQSGEARRIATTTRTHLASGPWYTRRLVDRAVAVVFEDHAVEGESVVLRYVEYTIRAPGR